MSTRNINNARKMIDDWSDVSVSRPTEESVFHPKTYVPKTPRENRSAFPFCPKSQDIPTIYNLLSETGEYRCLVDGQWIWSSDERVIEKQMLNDHPYYYFIAWWLIKEAKIQRWLNLSKTRSQHLTLPEEQNS